MSRFPSDDPIQQIVRQILAQFKGEYEHAIDGKGRVSFPARLRKYVNPQTQGRFTIVQGLGSERCLLLYPEDKWKEVEQKLSAINVFDRKGRKVLRNFLRSAEDITLDGHHRLALPPKLKSWANIDSRVIFIGTGEQIELWAPDELAAEDESLEDEDYNELFEQVLGNE